MLNFLVEWAEQLIIALIIIVMIEMVLPNNSSYRKYIKVILGIFVLYAIFNPIIKNKINNMSLEKDIMNKVQNVQISETSTKPIDYTKQIENTYKEKFKENLAAKLQEKGYELKNIKLDVTYDEQSIITNSLEIEITKQEDNKTINVEKIEISKKKPSIDQNEIEILKKEISENYDIEISKIFIESENLNV